MRVLSNGLIITLINIKLQSLTQKDQGPDVSVTGAG